jgi:putative flippase GtrA
MERVVSTLVRSVAASALVFAVELSGVALLDRAGVAAPIAFAAVQIVGTTLTFLLNKFWAFGAARTGRGYFEGVKSAVVFAGSFILNIALPSIATYWFAIVPVVAFTGSQVVIGLAWNFPLNRWWVFDAAFHEESTSCS